MKMAVTEIKMSYRKYKNQYPQCRTKPNSYNDRDKTIVVYVPVDSDTSSDTPVVEITVTNNPYGFLGTEKQIEYATTIFEDLIDTCEANIKKNLQLAKDHPIEVAYYQERVTAYQIILDWYHQSMEKFRGFEAKEIIEREKFFPLTKDLLSKAQTRAHNTGTSLIDALNELLDI